MPLSAQSPGSGTTALRVEGGMGHTARPATLRVVAALAGLAFLYVPQCSGGMAGMEHPAPSPAQTIAAAHDADAFAGQPQARCRIAPMAASSLAAPARPYRASTRPMTLAQLCVLRL